MNRSTIYSINLIFAGIAFLPGFLQAQTAPPFTVSGSGVNFEMRASGIFIARGGSGALTTADTTSGNVQMLWYPAQAAFRVGWSSSWDPTVSGQGYGYSSVAFGNSIASGDYAFAEGYSKASGPISVALITGTASGPKAFACGEGTLANAWASVALGYYTTASGNASFAMGGNSVAAAENSAAFGNSQVTSTGVAGMALGYYVTVTGPQSVGFGAGTLVSGAYSLAAGNYSVAAGPGSFAVGYGSVASGNYANALGNHCTALGDNSLAEGFATYAQALSSCVVGQYNLTGQTSTNGATTWNATDPLFEIGNGPDAFHPSDALIVYKSGNATFQGVVQVAAGGDIPMFGN